MAPVLSHLFQFATRSEKVIKPLQHASFTLDSSGVAGFFGGDGAVSGMATVNLYEYRRWGGWCNTPGSYEIAKQYGQLAGSRLWDGLFPGGTHDPAELFGLDGKPGPQFHAAHSGSQFARTGHLAYLIGRKTQQMDGDAPPAGRTTTEACVIVVDLPFVPDEIVQPALRRSWAGYIAVVPITFNVAACVCCGLADDWWSFGSILLGMVASGAACFVLGSGRLTFKHPKPADGAPRGDGILKLSDSGVIVLRGEEGAVNSLTRGRFFLRYKAKHQRGPDVDSEKGANGAGQHANGQPQAANVANKTRAESKDEPEGRPPGRLIGLCSVLLTAQFIVQLLLIPQGILFGQIMFIVTLAVSWVYNTYLSSLNKEDIQTDILLNVLYPQEKLKKEKKRVEDYIHKFKFGSWTAMAVFTCLALRSSSTKAKSKSLLNNLIPNDTEVWALWKKIITHRISKLRPLVDKIEDFDRQGLGEKDWSLLIGLESEDRNLLDTLLGDAEAAYGKWREYSSHSSA